MGFIVAILALALVLVSSVNKIESLRAELDTKDVIPGLNKLEKELELRDKGTKDQPNPRD